MEKDIYFGAGEGILFIAAKTPPADNGQDTEPPVIIILSPEGGEELARELPRLIKLARNLKAEAEADATASAQVSDGTLNLMAAKLVRAGYVWKNGGWNRKGEECVARLLPYPQATVKTYERLVARTEGK